MRGNRPARERFEFSLDARQVASVILGALAALGITFFLGYSLAHRVLERPPGAPVPPARGPADPLAALDQTARPDGGEPARGFNFHEALTSSKPPPERVQAAQKPATPAAPAKPPSPAPPLAPGAPAAARAAPPPVPVANAASTGAPAGASGPAAPPAPPAAPQAPPVPAAAPGRDGAFVVQVGSTTDRFEAERLALRFPGRGAKVTAADVPGKGRWYRVRIGSFKTREAAERYLRDLQRETGSTGFVTNAN